MNFKLSEVTTVQMGYSFRSRLELVEQGEIAVIQMKDLTDDNRVDCSGLMRIDMSAKKQHLVRPGDLVFRSRGQVTTSAILMENPGEAVVAAPLFRIRVKDDSVLPEFLNWFISQAPAQSYFTSHARGTAQQMISAGALKSLQVPLPSLERQRAIVEVAELAEREEALMRNIADKRHQYLSTKLLQAAEGE